MNMERPLRLIFSIHRATHRIGLYLQRQAPDVTQAEAHILCHLHEFGACTVAALHRAFAHRRSTLTSVLDRLESQRRITRKLSRTDRRSFVSALTASGRARAASIHRFLEAVEDQVRGDRDQIARVLEQIAGGS